jgi:hypothetical protein
VILKLARKIGYDSDLRIKLKNGKYLEKSNIVDLLTHAMSVGKVLYGEQEFIDLLADSDVDPDLIINDNVRIKLLQHINKSKENKGYDDVTMIKEVVTGPKKRIVEVDDLTDNNSRRVITVNRNGALINLNRKRRLTQPDESDEERVSVNRVVSNPRREITVNNDGAEINLDQRKRKRVHFDDESVEDDQIDETQWEI